MKTAIIIPARHDSTRFPGKVLAPIQGRPMIQWVWEAANKCKLAQTIIIATDDERVSEAAKAFGAEVVMTKKSHRSGTDRVAEVADKVPANLYVNVQGDEPLLVPSAVDELIRGMMESPRIPIGTLAHKLETEAEWKSPHVVKVVVDRHGSALYFSRSPLPFQKTFDPKGPLLRHVGIYAYRARALANFIAMAPSPLELAENLEQLRALENGLSIQVIKTRYRCLGVDTPGDLAKVEAILKLPPDNEEKEKKKVARKLRSQRNAKTKKKKSEKVRR